MTVETTEWWAQFWNQRRQQQHYFRDVPGEHVVRFAKVFFPSLAGKRVLEFGFGDGMDLLFFYAKGCNCYGVEASEEICRAFLERAGELDPARINIGNYRLLHDIAPGSIDLIYSMNVLHYLDSKKKIADLLGIFRQLLAKDGKILFSLVHPQHYFMDNSRRVDKDCREFTQGIPQREGLRFVLFETAKEIQELCADFTNNSVGCHEHTYDLQTRHKFWLVTGSK
jgi:SAM-dependent methyltransferase